MGPKGAPWSPMGARRHSTKVGSAGFAKTCKSKTGAKKQVETPMEYNDSWFGQRKGKRKQGRPKKMGRGMCRN